MRSKVTFADGSVVTYSYSASGTKLKAIHKIGSTTTTTDYCGPVIYENGVGKLLLTEGGYISLSDNKYHYYLQDHQGNNRVVIDQSGRVKETTHYYPFGGVFAQTGHVQPYKYNGKEFDSKNGLNLYDYGARMYDAALGRFTTVDPLAEKYYSTGGYGYCLNNPVNRIDPTGMASRYNWDNERYEDENGNEVSWENVQKEYGFGQANVPDDPPAKAEVDAITGATPKVSPYTEKSLVEVRRSNSIALPIPPNTLIFGTAIKSILLSPLALFLTIPAILQGDDSPAYVKEATNSSKNEKHGDGGRSLEKDEKQIESLKGELQEQGLSKKRQQQLKNKMKNIRQNGQKNKRGEEHSRQNKR